MFRNTNCVSQGTQTPEFKFFDIEVRGLFMKSCCHPGASRDPCALRIGVTIPISQIRQPRLKVSGLPDITQLKTKGTGTWTQAFLSSRNLRCYTHDFFVVISAVFKNLRTICKLSSSLWSRLCADGKCTFLAIYSRFYMSGSVPTVSSSRFILNIYYQFDTIDVLIKIHPLTLNTVSSNAVTTLSFHLDCQIFHGWFTINVGSSLFYLFKRSFFPSFLLHSTTLHFSS